MKTPTNPKIAESNLCPKYDKAMTLIKEVGAWAEQGFPGVTIHDLQYLQRIASNHEPERGLAEIRLRAERNANKLLGLPVRRERRVSAVQSGRLLASMMPPAKKAPKR